MSLNEHIKKLISQTGAISMAEFMQIALADPEYGYYKTSEPFGIKGDFTTAPEISQMFGELIGMWCVDIWHKMGTPADIEIVEIGPGRGTLMCDFLRATSKIKGFHDSVCVSMVETSQRLSDLQRTKINHMHPRIKWHNNISELPNKPLIIIANELFDALPVHQYVKQNGQWHEKMLGLNNHGKLEFALNPQQSKLPQKNNYEAAADGAITEICPGAITIIEEISNRINQRGGAALIIDYGYTEPQYKNTISAIGNHKHCKLLDDIGNVDISAHVDFQMLARLATNHGVKVFGPVSQGDFLQNLGIDIRTSALLKNASEQQQKDITTARDRLIGNAADQMGELFKVLALCAEKIIPEGF